MHKSRLEVADFFSNSSVEAVVDHARLFPCLLRNPERFNGLLIHTLAVRVRRVVDLRFNLVVQLVQRHLIHRLTTLLGFNEVLCPVLLANITEDVHLVENVPH